MSRSNTSRQHRPHCAHVHHPPFPEQKPESETVSAHAANDADRLLEDIFWAQSPIHDLLSSVLAWMVCLPAQNDVPAAALLNAERFRAQATPLRLHQKQLLSLLDFIASHRHAPSSDALTIKFHNDTNQDL